MIHSCWIFGFTVLSREIEFHSGLKPGLPVGLSTPTVDSHHVWTSITMKQKRLPFTLGTHYRGWLHTIKASKVSNSIDNQSESPFCFTEFIHMGYVFMSVVIVCVCPLTNQCI